MNDIADPKGILITGVIGEDVHIIGIRILEHALRDAGFRIISLGAQVSQEQFIEAAIETNGDVMVGTIKAVEEGIHEYHFRIGKERIGNPFRSL
jgi:methanogenic corrinoid protein MtbC1